MSFAFCQTRKLANIRKFSRKFVELQYSEKLRQTKFLSKFTFPWIFSRKSAKISCPANIFTKKIPFVWTNCEYFCLFLLKHPRKICIDYFRGYIFASNYCFWFYRKFKRRVFENTKTKIFVSNLPYLGLFKHVHIMYMNGLSPSSSVTLL